MTCKDPPSEGEPFLLDCDVCGGADETCKACGGEGRIRITECPRHMMTGDVLDMVEHVDVMTELRILPVAGGTLDQTQCYEDVRRTVAREQARLKRGRQNT